LHFLFAPDADAEVRRLTESRFGVDHDAGGIYLVDLRTGDRVEIMHPVPPEFDFAKVDLLSRRERQLFESLGEGRSMKEIADQMAISVKTLETYRARVKQKLDVGDGILIRRMATEWKRLERTGDGA
jgi:DNA-binding NarL/FixJ family response regulator